MNRCPSEQDDAPTTTRARRSGAGRTGRYRRPSLLGVLLTVLALLVGLAACADAPGGDDAGDAVGPQQGPSGGAEGQRDGAGGGEDRAGDSEAGAARDEGAQDGSRAGGETGDEAAAGADVAEVLTATYGSSPEGAMVARDAEIELVVDELAPAAAKVRAAAVAVDGYVVSEEVYPEPDGPGGHATLVLSVPAARLDRALDQVAPVGDERGRSMWSEDVTADYVDTSARVETLEVSVERTRRLMEQAASIEDVVALERELARREADLDALKAHLAALEDDVARSTLTVHLAASDEALQQAEPAPAGFLAGLDRGWGAFTTFVTGLLTVVGATLPFLLLALLLLGPVLLVVRRRRGRTLPGTGT